MEYTLQVTSLVAVVTPHAIH